MSDCSTTPWLRWPGACTPPPARHTVLRTRELTVASASSFIIVVTVAVVGILLLCAASSFRHHRRALRALDAAPPCAHAGTQPAPPRLWDVYLPELPQHAPRGALAWAEVLPLAAVADVEAAPEEVDVPQKRAPGGSGRRAAGWFRPWHRRPRAQQSTAASPAAPRARLRTPDVGAVEVALFVAMPAPPQRASGGEECAGLWAECAGLWAECAVGTSRIPYRRTGDDSVVAAAS